VRAGPFRGPARTPGRNSEPQYLASPPNRAALAAFRV